MTKSEWVKKIKAEFVPFQASQFTPTQYSTAGDKAKFANHFVRFVLSGFKRTLFPKWFYVQLSFMWGHIAHYNQNGFYETWFTSREVLVDFFTSVENGSSYGDAAYTFCDVERALAMWSRDCGISILVGMRENETFD